MAQMDGGNGVAERDLAKLKSLASGLLGTEAPDPAVLDEVAALAAAVASYRREQSRLELLGQVLESARAIFPKAGDELRSHLAPSAPAELADLLAALGGATEARTAFARADAELMTARDRGDYGAMVPFVLEAESRKKAFDAATAEFVSRIGFGGRLMTEIGGAASVAVAPENRAAPPNQPDPPPPPPASPAGPPSDAAGDDPPDAAAAPAHAFEEAPAEPVHDPAMPPESPAGRRRIRDLIRQVRTTPDEPHPAR
jgi:hypothetical protein